ncbi:MAG: hypothetical protein IRY83_13565 [Chloroflexi bacterium]|nr:hypothetical protein [Chloroflexota bacterium]
MSRLARRAAALLIAVLLAGAGPTAAHAEVDWCGGDPPVHLALPNGMPLELTVHLSVPVSHRAALRAATVTGQAIALDGARAAVALTVSVPDDGQGSFPVVVAVGLHGETVATVTDQSGTAIPVSLTVTLPTGLAAP